MTIKEREVCFTVHRLPKELGDFYVSIFLPINAAEKKSTLVFTLPAIAAPEEKAFSQGPSARWPQYPFWVMFPPVFMSSKASLRHGFLC